MASRGRSEDRKSRDAQLRETAEEVALAAFGFVAAEPRLLARFLDMTGIAVEQIREATREADFLAGVLDHVAGDESLLLAFAAQNKIDPNEVIRARDLLSGGNCGRGTPMEFLR